jgi:hypothetical protein
MATKAENTERLLADAEKAHQEWGAGSQIQWIGVSDTTLYEKKAGPYEVRKMPFLEPMCAVQTETQGLVPFFSSPLLGDAGVQLMNSMICDLDDEDLFPAVLALLEEQK